MSTSVRFNPLSRLGALVAVLATLGLALPAAAQQAGRIEGVVRKAADGSPVQGVSVTVEGTGIRTVTGTNGAYTLPRVPAGQHVLIFRWLGFRPQQATVTVTPGGTETVDVNLEAQVIALGEITVEGASRTPERIVEAPSAASVIDPVALRDRSPAGQAPKVLNQVPGLDVTQSGVNDFNVNARGFNSTLNRRMLVLQDGRDLAIASLGAQEWHAMSIPLEDVRRLEVVRGPGSALYGANAFAGVVNITTPAARDIVGTKVTLAGGELTTMRGDVRHAGVSPNGRIGYRFNFGYNRSDSWSRSRTRFDGSDAAAEYGDVTDEPVTTGVPSCQTLGSNCLSIERQPLAGQSASITDGSVSGDPEALQSIYGSTRFDYYVDNGSIFTAEGGAAKVENEVFITGIGRVQVRETWRPWARLAYNHDNYSLSAWYNGRDATTPQRSLSSGLDIDEQSAIIHFEGQYNRAVLDDQMRFVVGASYRNYMINTDGTLMAPANDDRSDDYLSAYGQVDYRPVPKLRLVAAARVDDGTLFDTQFSPKGAVVFSPHPDHAIRASVNRAFQTPNYSEFFLNVQAGATASPATLEGGLESYYAALQNPAVVGPALAAAMGALGLPSDVPWNFPAETPVQAVGYPDLDVETVTGWELGYKGNVSQRAYVSVDLYLNQLSNFVTDLLFGANLTRLDLADGVDVAADLAAIDATLAGVGLPATHPLRVSNADLQAGFAALNGTPGLTTLAGIGPAIGLSYAQAGEVEERGIEFGVGYGFTPELRVDANYTYFEFDIEDPGLTTLGQQIVPNTPKHKANISVAYTGVQGVDAAASLRILDGFEWNAGVFAGRVPAAQTLDLNLGYRANNYLRVFASATNVLDQEHFQIYGGSVIGRRILGGVTATF